MDLAQLRTLLFYPAAGTDPRASEVGFRFGEIGTHSSRTLMLEDLMAVLAAVPSGGDRKAYANAVIENNTLGKSTAATRRATNQRLGELYSLDPNCPLFRVLRRLWSIDEKGRPLLALLAALARDPLLLSSAVPVLSLTPGAEVQRTPIKAALKKVTGERFNDEVLDKIFRNIASSWTQSGHLKGRTLKTRSQAQATPATAAYALYLGHAAGFRGEELLTCGWAAVLDCSVSSVRELALEAKRIELIDLRIGGDVFELGLERLDPGVGGK